MKKKLIVLILLLSFILTSCNNTIEELAEEPIESPTVVLETTESDEKRIITSILKWHSEMSALLGNFSHYSDLLSVILEDEVIETIIQEESHLLEYGSDEYIQRITQWVEENMAHTQLQEEYSDFKGNEPWNGTYKKILLYEMKKLGMERNIYMGKCTSLANFIISMLRNSGLSKDDYILLIMPSHTLGIFKYNDEFYVIDNNKIILMTDDMKEKPFLYIGYYHEDSSMITKFRLSEDFYEHNSDESLTQRILKLNNISEDKIYKSNLNDTHKKYIEHRIDVQDFNLYAELQL